MMKETKLTLVLMLALGGWYATSVHAEGIEVPEVELARETTLPIFDQRRAVLNRSVVTAERLEFGLGGCLEMNEPFYNDCVLSAQLTYNFDETHALNIQGLYWMDGLSNYGEQLKDNKCKAQGGDFCPFDASLAPHPNFALIPNYQFTAYYG